MFFILQKVFIFVIVNILLFTELLYFLFDVMTKQIKREG